MKRAHLFTAFLVLAGIAAATPAFAQGFLKELKDAVTAGIDPKVRGRVHLADGQTLTCFEGVKAGYIGPADLMSPGYTTRSANGTLTTHTAAIPAMVMLPPATVTSNHCDARASQGALVAEGGTAAASAGGAKLPPKTPCRDVPEADHAQYPRCISFDPQDHCSALPIDGTWGTGQND